MESLLYIVNVQCLDHEDMVLGAGSNKYILGCKWCCVVWKIGTSIFEEDAASIFRI
jgi:hypothetical protein